MALRETLVIIDGLTEVKSLGCCAGRWREASGVAKKLQESPGEKRFGGESGSQLLLGFPLKKLGQGGKQPRTVEFGPFR